jgi:hypothetical protein
MATQSTISSTSNSLHVRYDRSEVFLGEIKTIENQTFRNTTSGTLTYPIGTLVGRLTSGGKLVPLTSAATNGSQIPVGLLAQEVTLAATSDDNVCIAIAGVVDSSKVTLAGSDTLATVITELGQPISDAIHSFTSGIRLISVRQFGETDNA